MKFKLDQSVVVSKSAKTGKVNAIHVNAAGTHYDVVNGVNTSKPFRYKESDLVSESAHKKAQIAALKSKVQAGKKSPIAKAKPVVVAVEAEVKAKAPAKPAKKKAAKKKAPAKKKS